jgi:hypothetical protein
MSGVVVSGEEDGSFCHTEEVVQPEGNVEEWDQEVFDPSVTFPFS